MRGEGQSRSKATPPSRSQHGVLVTHVTNSQCAVFTAAAVAAALLLLAFAADQLLKKHEMRLSRVQVFYGGVRLPFMMVRQTWSRPFALASLPSAPPSSFCEGVARHNVCLVLGVDLRTQPRVTLFLANADTFQIVFYTVFLSRLGSIFASSIRAWRFPIT
jgi:hypothetical protein